jgi:serine/threonine protein kinase
MDRAVLETSSDRYVIVEYIAEGGMGAIYLGKKIGVGGFEKEVVLKQLLPEFTREPKFIDLFLREARLSASLDHANIVRTVDLVTAGDDYFMVMEYVRGGDLRTLLRLARRRHQIFPPQAAVFIGHELLEALTYAHTRTGPDGRPLGLIHRDVSPSNILLSGAGEVKLTDFGIAKASTHRSVFFKVKGKVGYMAPEQARGEPIDARTDLFSLGVVLYEVLVGERLFVGDLLSTAAAIYSQEIAAPSRRRPGLPAEMDAVILKALSLDPRGRFQTAAEFQEALSRVASKNRLLCGASEMASVLRQVCGDDPSVWLRMENLPSEETHGTAILTGAADDEFDGESPSARSAMKALPAKKEFTSVIAIAKPRAREADSEPVRLPTPTPGDSFLEPESKRTTIVREPAAPRRPAPADEETLVRQSSPRVDVRDRTAQTLPAPADPPLQPAPSDNTDSLRKEPQRLWPLVLVLLLIGVGVALGVAFSGPELEVIDPTLPATPAAEPPR